MAQWALWFVPFVAVVTAAEGCNFSALEIVQVQDASISFAPFIEPMKSVTTKLVSNLAARYDNFRMAITGFVDKPVPFRGYGRYGANRSKPDYCYRLFAPLTQDPEVIAAALLDLENSIGVGMDLRENQLEALIFSALDPAVGWSPIRWLENDPTVVRVLLLVTDDGYHSASDADDAITFGWNVPRNYPKGPAGESTGGFGSHDFWKSRLFSGETAYRRMADLYRLVDHNFTLSDAEKMELVELVEFFGPSEFPTPQPFPGDNSQPACEQTEYPSVAQVADVLRDRNVVLAVLVPREKGNIMSHYVALGEALGILTVVAPMDSNLISENIVDVVTAATEAVCQQRPSPQPSPGPFHTTGLDSTTVTTKSTVTTPEVFQTGPDTQPEDDNDNDDKGSIAGILVGASIGGFVLLASGGGYAAWRVLTAPPALADVSAEAFNLAGDPVERESLEQITPDMFG